MAAYDTFGDEEAPLLERPDRARPPRVGTAAAALVLVGCVAILLTSGPSTDMVDAPLWLQHVAVGHGPARDDRVRRTLVRHGITEEQFWTLTLDEAKAIFPDHLSDAIAVARLVRDPVVRANHTEVDGIITLKGSPRITFYWACGILSLLVCVYMYQEGDDNVMKQFQPDSLVKQKSRANIYRLIAVVPESVIAEGHRSYAAILVIAFFSAWMQIYLPWTTARSFLLASRVHLDGFKTLTWLGQHWLGVLTSLAALVTMGIMFIKNVQGDMLAETSQCLRLLTYSSPDEVDQEAQAQLAAEERASAPRPAAAAAKPQSPSAKERARPKKVGSQAASPRMQTWSSKRKKSFAYTSGAVEATDGVKEELFFKLCCFKVPRDVWEGFWSLLSLFVCYWSGLLLSIAMFATVVSFNGDTSAFVLSTMRVFFLMSIDEKLIDCLPQLSDWYVQFADIQTVAQDGASRFWQPKLRSLILGVDVCLDTALVIGLFVLIFTSWREVDTGAMVGVGAGS